MKLLFINSVCGIGSTGRICTDLAQEYYEKNYEKKMSKLREEKKQLVIIIDDLINKLRETTNKLRKENE